MFEGLIQRANENLVLFSGNVCARCGATGVALIRDEQCANCCVSPQIEVPPVLVMKCPSDRTQEMLNTREALLDMWHRLRVRGLLQSHCGIFIADHDATHLSVKVMETTVPSEWYQWCKRRVER